MAFDKTNTAIVFVEDGLFNKEGVEALGRKPILVVKANIGGTEKEISLWFAKDKETGEYKTTTQGHKFLTGKVDDPYKAVEYNKDSTTTAPPVFADPQATTKADDDLPF